MSDEIKVQECITCGIVTTVSEYGFCDKCQQQYNIDLVLWDIEKGLETLKATPVEILKARDNVILDIKQKIDKLKRKVK